MALFKAEDSAYYYHHALRWKWYLLYPQLCRVQGPKISAPIVKLRVGRRHFTEMFKAHGGQCQAAPGIGLSIPRHKKRLLREPLS
jgi:hypothetical protein